MPGHKFNPAKAKLLNNPFRRWILSPTQVFEDVKPAAGSIWTEIGAGTGYFTIPLARRVDKVYGVDISREMLNLLEANLTKTKTGNVELKQSEESSIPLDSSSTDGVFLAFVAHELNEPESYLKEISRILKPGGRLIIVEYAKVPSWGPPLEHRLNPEDVDRWADQADLHKGTKWQWSKSIVGWEYLK